MEITKEWIDKVAVANMNLKYGDNVRTRNPYTIKDLYKKEHREEELIEAKDIIELVLRANNLIN